jgi:hypothetical protein
MPGGIRLYREAVLTEDGLTAKLTIYPATIVQARYGGSYEGAPWVCSRCMSIGSPSQHGATGTATRSSAASSGGVHRARGS